MLLDETAQYPMTFVTELRLRGSLSRAAIEAAFSETLQLHPLLTARVEPSWWRRSMWVPAEIPPAVTWYPPGTPPLPHPKGIDITAEPGVRMCVRDDPHTPVILLEFHHAATDGLGALHFVGDLLARYGQRTTEPGSPSAVPAPVAVEQLTQRERLWPNPDFRRGLWLTTFERSWDLSRQRLQPVAGRRGPQSADSAPEFPGYHTRVLSSDLVRSLKQAAARRMVTLNDLATAAMFRALHEWNLRCGVVDPKSFLRLSLPLNLRTPSDEDAPAANHLSMMLMSRRGCDLGDDAELLAYVRRTADSATWTCRGRLFTFWVGGIALHTPWLYRLGGGRGMYCSAVLANVGDVRRHLRGRFPLDQGRIVAGSVRLDAVLGAACVRHGVRVAMTILAYNGQLYLNMNRDPAFLDGPAGEDLLDLYVAQLTSWSNGGRPVHPVV